MVKYKKHNTDKIEKTYDRMLNGYSSHAILKGSSILSC